MVARLWIAPALAADARGPDGPQWSLLCDLMRLVAAGRRVNGAPERVDS